MSIIKEIFQIRSCTVANDIKINTTDHYALQLTKNYKVYILGDLHPLKGITGTIIQCLFSAS